jgi:hypothetical protein
VIAVPLEEERDGAALLGKEFKVEFPTIFDPKYKIADGYGVDRGGGGTPYCVLICRDGKVVVNGDIDITREGAVISWVEGTQVKFVPLEKAVKELAETK